MKAGDANFEEDFLKVQQSLSAAQKDGKNSHFGSEYATYASTVKAVKSHLNENGFTFRHTSRFDGTHYFVGTQLTHALTGTKGDIYEVPIPLGTPQQLGSGTSYAKRYSLQAICGLPTDDDDDGNQASQQTTTRTIQSPKEKITIPADGSAATAKQISFAASQQVKRGWTEEETCKVSHLMFGQASWRNLTKKDMSELIETIGKFNARDVIKDLTDLAGTGAPTDVFDHNGLPF